MTKELLRTSLVVALWSAAMWFAWLGWDHGFYEVNGVAQGPYRAWQVVGCGAAVTLGAVIGYLRSPGRSSIWIVAAAGVVGFAVPWGRDASGDESGMWLVGLMMLLVGGFIGLSMLLGLIWLMRDADRTDGRWSEEVIGFLAIVGCLLLVTPVFPLGVVVLGIAAVSYVRRRRNRAPLVR